MWWPHHRLYVKRNAWVSEVLLHCTTWNRLYDYYTPLSLYMLQPLSFSCHLLSLHITNTFNTFLSTWLIYFMSQWKWKCPINPNAIIRNLYHISLGVLLIFIYLFLCSSVEHLNLIALLLIKKWSEASQPMARLILRPVFSLTQKKKKMKQASWLGLIKQFVEGNKPNSIQFNHNKHHQ